MATKKYALLPGSRRKKDPHAIRVGKVDPKTWITVTIGLSGLKLPGPDEWTASSRRFLQSSTKPRSKPCGIVAGLIRCLYCNLAMQGTDLGAHLQKCPVRQVVNDTEAKLNRLLTDEEIEEIEERF